MSQEQLSELWHVRDHGCTRALSGVSRYNCAQAESQNPGGFAQLLVEKGGLECTFDNLHHLMAVAHRYRGSDVVSFLGEFFGVTL